jgi:hypothetical protein
MENNYIMDNDGSTYEEYENAFKEALKSTDERMLETVNLDGAIANHLTIEEAVYLMAYTGHSAKWINSSINTGQFEKDASKANFVRTLDTALSKIPILESSVVYRMDDCFSMEQMKSLEVGHVRTIKSYFSTSKEDWETTDIVWVITPLSNNSLARDISNITGFAAENEVLFGRGASFELTNKIEKDGKLFLYFKEK